MAIQYARVQQTEAAPKEEKESTFDKIAKALSLAQSLTGTAMNVVNFKEALASNATAKQQRERIARSQDPLSDESQTARQTITGVGIEVPENLTEEQAEKQYGPIGKLALEQKQAQSQKPISPLDQEKLNLEREKIAAMRAGNLDTKSFRMDGLQDKKVLALSKGIEDLIEPAQTLKNIDALVGGIENYNEETDDIPGAGATGFLPKPLLSKEGAEIKTNVKGLVNQLLKIRSGSAVTPQEAARVAEEIGSASTDRDLMLGLSRLKQLMALRTGAVLAGHAPETVSQFEQRMGMSLKDIGFGKQERIVREDVGDVEPVEASMGGKKQPVKPKTLKQNGHTYILNEQTGEYE